ncbi:hypothetical protein ACHAWF_003183 [Thalassiosira exigua]
MGWEEKAAKAKKGHRPSLRDWERDGLAGAFPPFAEALLASEEPYQSLEISPSGDATERRRSRERAREAGRRARRRGGGGGAGGTSADGSTTTTTTTAVPAVLDAAETSPREFHDAFEAPCVPTVIRGIPYGDRGPDRTDDAGAKAEEEEKKECDGRSHGGGAGGPDGDGREGAELSGARWPAARRWKLDALFDDSDLADRPLKCGEDDDGYTIRMKLRHFLEYLRYNRDDSPLYIFDATFDEDRSAKRILDDYRVPSYFEEDLLGLVGERRRPPYRWFLVGPCRSGTTVHIDPLGTSAWNTLVHGVKRWVLFPPHVPKSVVKGRKLLLPGEDDEAIHYFTAILPRIKRRAAASGGTGEHAGFACHEFTQFAGETVFVPRGWWHAVLNVTHTVGITQNYCSSRNFDEVWTRTRSGRKKMACTWLRRLDDARPELARRARELNRRDGFVMWEDDPEEQRRWRKKRAEKERRRREKKERKEKKKERERSRERKAKKEKWGEHRTAERRRDGDGEDGDVAMREVSPGDY